MVRFAKLGRAASYHIKSRLPHLSRLLLVVLSACKTGIEQYYKGEVAIGLARPFQSAGILFVMANVWPVESYPTKELMVAFHKHRKSDGLSTAQALRAVKFEGLQNAVTFFDA